MNKVTGQKCMEKSLTRKSCGCIAANLELKVPTLIMILKCCLGMNDDAVQAGVLKEFFEFLKAQGTKVNITPIDASKIIVEVLR